jgi:hypothetical protein
VARHGYLREYDEVPDRSEDRNEGWNERNRGFMLDRDRSEDFSGRTREGRAPSFRAEDRNWGGSGRDEWQGAGYARERGYGGFQGDFGRSGRDQGGFEGRGDWERAPRNFSSRQDDHYLSWRDRQMRALDNDYADYCREREQQFHSDFDNWRRARTQRSGREAAVGEAAELELTQERALAGEGNTPSPVDEATLGTSNSENTSRGRR